MGPTIVLVRSGKGRICGGFTSVSWASGTDTYEFDDKAFLFSVSLSKIYPVINQNRAVVLKRDNGFNFGGGVLD